MIIIEMKHTINGMGLNDPQIIPYNQSVEKRSVFCETGP